MRLSWRGRAGKNGWTIGIGRTGPVMPPREGAWPLIATGPTLLKPRPWSAMLQLLHTHARCLSDWSCRRHRDNHPPLTTPSSSCWGRGLAARRGGVLLCWFLMEVQSVQPLARLPTDVLTLLRQRPRLGTTLPWLLMASLTSYYYRYTGCQATESGKLPSACPRYHRRCIRHLYMPWLSRSAVFDCASTARMGDAICHDDRLSICCKIPSSDYLLGP